MLTLLTDYATSVNLMIDATASQRSHMLLPPSLLPLLLLLLDRLSAVFGYAAARYAVSA